MKLAPQLRKSPRPRARTGPATQRAVSSATAARSPRSGVALASPRFGLAETVRPSAGSPAGGLPEPLGRNLEAMSGLSMDDVRVHRNSPEPATLGALAYTKGSDIHLGPGQEKHLAHEA